MFNIFLNYLPPDRRLIQRSDSDASKGVEKAEHLRSVGRGTQTDTTTMEISAQNP